MKLLVCYGVATVLGLWTLGRAATEEATLDSVAHSAVGAADARAAIDSFGPDWSNASVEELRAMHEVGAAGVSTHRVNAARAGFPAVVAVAPTIKCGSAEGGVAPATTAVGCGADIPRAMASANLAVDLLLAIFHPNDCEECAIPNGCQLSISTLDGNWTFGMPFKSGNEWCIRATYSGPYLYACSPCVEEE